MRPAPRSPPISGQLPPAERRRLTPLAAAVRSALAAPCPELVVVSGELPASGRVALLAGTFNPLTRAHVAVAHASRRAGWPHVVFALAPRSIHKERVERAHLLDRIDWTARWARRRGWTSVAVASRPLLVEMAEALRARTGAPVGLVVGTDKAVQLTDPRYYDDVQEALGRLARMAILLVAPRGAAGGVPSGSEPGADGGPHLRSDPMLVSAARVRTVGLRTPRWALGHSSTEARRAAARGDRLAGVVPAEVARAIRRTGAYDADPSRYAARARALDSLLRP